MRRLRRGLARADRAARATRAAHARHVAGARPARLACPPKRRAAQGAHADRHRQRATGRCRARRRRDDRVDDARAVGADSVSSADDRASARRRARRDARARNAGRRGSRDAAGRRRDVRRARRDRAQHRAARPAPARLPGTGARAGRRGTRAGQVRRDGGRRRRERQRRRIERRAIRGRCRRSRRAMALPAAHRGRQARGRGRRPHGDPVCSRRASRTPPNPRTNREAEPRRIANISCSRHGLRGRARPARRRRSARRRAAARRDAGLYTARAMASSGASTATCSRFKATTTARSMPTRRPSPPSPATALHGRRRMCRSRISTSLAISTTWR